MDTYRVDFGRPIALFVLPTVGLVPHLSQGFHIYEERYRQMVESSIAAGGGDLDRSLPIAVSVAGRGGQADVGGIRPVVCVGRLSEIDRFPDGRFNIMTHGVCRARIDEIVPPEGDRLFPQAWLRPLEVGEPDFAMPEVRSTLRSLLHGPRLSRLRCGELVRRLASLDDVPVSAMLDLVGYWTFEDVDLRYDLLAQPDSRERAAIVTRELQVLDRLVSMVDSQHPAEWPKGISWN